MVMVLAVIVVMALSLQIAKLPELPGLLAMVLSVIVRKEAVPATRMALPWVAKLPVMVLSLTVAVPAPLRIPPPWPGNVLLVLLEIVLSVTLRMPVLEIPPPLGAVLPESVLPVSVRFPLLEIPPPLAKVPEALLPEIVLPVSVRLPLLRIPPPSPAIAPFAMVSPEMVTCTPELMVNTRVVLPPLTARLVAPGPVMVRLLSMTIGPDVKVMVAQGGLSAKLMVSPPAGFEAATACRRDPAPLS